VPRVERARDIDATGREAVLKRRHARARCQDNRRAAEEAAPRQGLLMKRRVSRGVAHRVIISVSDLSDHDMVPSRLPPIDAV
jgi:hypothetical protein